MKNAVLWAVVAACAMPAVGYANSYYASTDQLGYTGEVTNTTQGTPAVPLSTPRDAAIYLVNGVPSFDVNSNIASSDWYEQPVSNQNNSLFQLYDSGESVTSQSGTWDSTGTVFTVKVTGANAPYNNPPGDSYSRFWQPDQNDAWGVNFENYTLTLTAQFDTPAAMVGDVLTSQGNLVSMSGEFSGTFQATQDFNTNPIANGDMYSFDVLMSYNNFVANQTTNPLVDEGYGVQNSSEFGEVVTPLPSSAGMGLAVMGLLGVAGLLRKRFSAA